MDVPSATLLGKASARTQPWPRLKQERPQRSGAFLFKRVPKAGIESLRWFASLRTRSAEFFTTGPADSQANRRSRGLRRHYETAGQPFRAAFRLPGGRGTVDVRVQLSSETHPREPNPGHALNKKGPNDLGPFSFKRGHGGESNHFVGSPRYEPAPLSSSLLVQPIRKRIGVRAVRRHVTKRQDSRFAQPSGCPKGEVHGRTECNSPRKAIRANPTLATIFFPWATCTRSGGWSSGPGWKLDDETQSPHEGLIKLLTRIGREDRDALVSLDSP